MNQKYILQYTIYIFVEINIFARTISFLIFDQILRKHLCKEELISMSQLSNDIPFTFNHLLPTNDRFER